MKLAIVFALLVVTGCSGGGETTGVITSVKRDGVFCQTWNVDAIADGGNGSAAGYRLQGTIRDSDVDLVRKAQAALAAGRRVRFAWVHAPLAFCGTSNFAFVVGIEALP